MTGQEAGPTATKVPLPLADLISMFEWNNRYSVQIASIDAQHQTLFRLAEELYAAMTAGHGKSSLSRILDRLVQYTIVHFAHEERLMRLHGFPDFAAHKAQHEELTRKVQEFQAEFIAGKAAMTVQLMHFLRDWLTGHIAGSDQKYSPFLRDKLVA
jgi:hemerythrin-like metal-binding protein